jgi:hypothetical protein
MSTIQAFFFIGIYFFYFISNNNCRLLTINIVSFIFFYYRESKPPFCLHYEKSSPLNIVYRKINWQNPASISAYTHSELLPTSLNYLALLSVPDEGVSRHVSCTLKIRYLRFSAMYCNFTKFNNYQYLLRKNNLSF